MFGGSRALSLVCVLPLERRSSLWEKSRGSQDTRGLQRPEHIHFIFPRSIRTPVLSPGAARRAPADRRLSPDNTLEQNTIGSCAAGKRRRYHAVKRHHWI